MRMRPQSKGLSRMLLVHLLLSLCTGGLAASPPEVEVSQGRILGQTLLSRKGREYHSFTSIPYAQPPLGKLRFNHPQPGLPWSGVLNATIPSPFCYQKPFLLFETEMLGQEDCLYLSVYTPKLDGNLPVMVYIHGGAFTYGYPGLPMKFSYFMDEDVVLVSVAYRLGYLGFLSFEDYVIPGNYGLKDQALALKWIKQEIKNFGGNPDLITVFGISAGAVSSNYLCSLPATRDLLAGCISQSGVGGSFWSLHTPGDAREAALDLAKKVGCSDYLGSELLSCLQALPVESFITNSTIVHVNEILAPVIEEPSDTAIITQWPVEDATSFPWIAGTVANEGLLLTEYLKAFGTIIEKIGVLIEGDKLLVQALHLKDHILEKLLKIKLRFFNWHDIFNPYDAFEKFFTEAFWMYPMLKELVAHSGPKYMYKFEYKGGPSLLEQMSNQHLKIDGVCHGDDASYYFNLSNYYQPEGWPGTNDVQMSENLVKMWVNFATTQVPNASLWSQFENDGSYLHITNEGLKMEKFTKLNDVLDFWNDILS